jgi:serine protease AprX
MKKEDPIMLRRLTASLTVLSLLLVSLAPLTAPALAAPAAQSHGKPQPQRKLAPEFDGAATSGETVRVIVQTKGLPNAAQDQAINARRGAKRQTLDALDVLVADLPASEVASLAARDDVAYVSPDRAVKAEMDVTREATGASLVQAGTAGPAESPGFTGKGVTIAVIDSGISASHPDFQKNNKSRVVASVNFTGDNLPGDRYGHGTGVAGVAAGNGSASRGYAGNYAGIAPEADLVDLKALDAQGRGTTSSTLAAINWAIQNRQRYNIRVLNMSLGTPVRESFRTDPLSQALAHATGAGIIVVCSAGNNGRTDEIVGHDASGDPIYRQLYGAVNSPGNSPYAITVGATDTHATARRSDDTVAQFSSRGPTRFDHLPKPDLVAPGRRLVAPLSQDNPTLASEYPDRVVQPAGGEDPVEGQELRVGGARVLRQVPDVAGAQDLAGRRQALAGEDPGQRRLACSVAPDQPHLVSRPDPEGDVVHQQSRPGSDLELLGTDHQAG